MIGIPADIIPSRTLPCGTGEVTFHALSVSDLVSLSLEFIHASEEGAKLLDSVAANPEQLLQFGASAVARAPEFVAKIIATSAGDPNAVSVALMLPVGFQLQAIEAILELTTSGADLPAIIQKFSAAIALAMPQQQSIGPH